MGEVSARVCIGEDGKIVEFILSATSDNGATSTGVSLQNVEVGGSTGRVAVVSRWSCTTEKQLRIVVQENKCTVSTLSSDPAGSKVQEPAAGITAEDVNEDEQNKSFSSDTIISDFKAVELKALEAKFGGGLVASLSLNRVKFNNVDELRKCIFKDFPCLNELTLNCVVVHNAAAATGILASSSSETIPASTFERNSDLRRLQITRDEFTAKELTGTDVFDVWGFDEIFRQFCKLEHLSYEGENCYKFPQKKEFFDALNAAEIQLSSLHYVSKPGYVEDSIEEVCALKRYLYAHGKALRQVSGYWGNEKSVGEAFEDFDPKLLVKLEIVGVNLDTFGVRGSMFMNLKKITISHCGQRTMNFLHRMPNVRLVDYRFDFVSEEFQRINRNSAPYASIEVATFINCGALNHCYDAFSAFKDVKKVFIKEERAGSDEWIYATDGASLESLLPLIGQNWPGVISLSISGPCGLADGDFVTHNREGNVSIEAMRRMFYYVPGLEVFEYSDELEKVAALEEAETQEELDYFMTLDETEWDLDVDMEYAMFHEREPTESKVMKRRICFGTEALKWFGWFRKLRILRLERAFVTAQESEFFREKLALFEIKNTM